MNRTGHAEVRARPWAEAFAFRLGLIVAVGVAIRVLYTVLLAPWPPSNLGDDQFFYHVEPTLLANGHGFINWIDALRGQTVPTAAHPPLYPLALAPLAKLGGAGADAQRLAGSAFGAGTIVALGLLARRLAGSRVGLLAAAIAAIYPMLITADGALMSESLFGLLIAVSLLAAYSLLDATTVGRAMILGAFLGLAALTRGEALLLVPLMLVPVLLRPAGVRAAVITCLTVAAVVLPWTIRNWVTFDRPVLISTNFASAIAGANCHSTYYGSKIGSWDNSCVTHNDSNEAVALDEAQSHAIRYATHHLSRLPAVAIVRLARVWGLRRNFFTKLPDVAGRSQSALEAGFLMYYALVVLAVYGFALLRQRRVPLWLLMTPFMLVTVNALLIYGDVRFREPAELSLVVLGAVGVDNLWHRLASKRQPATT